MDKNKLVLRPLNVEDPEECDMDRALGKHGIPEDRRILLQAFGPDGLSYARMTPLDFDELVAQLGVIGVASAGPHITWEIRPGAELMMLRLMQDYYDISQTSVDAMLVLDSALKSIKERA